MNIDKEKTGEKSNTSENSNNPTAWKYRAYCTNHKEYLNDSWGSKEVAEINKKNHLASFSGHYVFIKRK